VDKFCNPRTTRSKIQAESPSSHARGEKADYEWKRTGGIAFKSIMRAKDVFEVFTGEAHITAHDNSKTFRILQEPGGDDQRTHQ
jgi:hypothetical protein